jgi:hypothetical protein
LLCFAYTIQCIVDKSDTNAVSLWQTDWDPSSASVSRVYYLRQGAGDESVGGIGGVAAFHVSYETMYRYRASTEALANPNTFSLSLYQDGSMRMRYHSILTSLFDTDKFGLWGSRASSAEKSNLHYHREAIDSAVVADGVDIVFCDTSLLVCPVRACVLGGGSLEMYWSGSMLCIALGSGVVDSVQCSWGGGLAVTPGSLGDVGGRQTLRCPAPALNVSDGALLNVDIAVAYAFADTSAAYASAHNLTVLNTDVPGRKRAFAVSDTSSLTGAASGSGSGSALTRHQVMVRYYPAGSAAYSSAAATCGCSAAPSGAGAGAVCDACGVCGGEEGEEAEARAGSVDCNGDCFGRAYVDDCTHCSAGLTLLEPDNSCNLTDGAYLSDPPEEYNEDFTGQLVFIIIVVCCMSCVFSICMYFSRTLFVGDQNPNIGLDFIFIEQTPNQQGILTQQRQRAAASRGLSAFERDALGTVQYSPALFPADSDYSECAICLLNFKPGEVCRILPEPCSHCFHIDCVDKWFEVSPACPLCKRSIKKILLGEPESLSPAQFDIPIHSAADIEQSIVVDPSRSSDLEETSTHSGVELVSVSRSSRDGAYDRV